MSQTRQIRKPALKLVTAAPTEANKSSSSIMHDARGTAVWVGEPSALDDLSALTLLLEPTAPPPIDGDPYNRPASAFGSRPATSAFKRRR